MPRRKAPLERSVRVGIVTYLKTVPRCLVVPYPAGMYGATGASDLLLCVAGRFVAIEIKREGQHPTPMQQAFLQSVIRAGGVGYVVHSLDELKALLAQGGFAWMP